jgi:4'-phosphopantetheinyl transferase
MAAFITPPADTVNRDVQDPSRQSTTHTGHTEPDGHCKARVAVISKRITEFGGAAEVFALDLHCEALQDAQAYLTSAERWTAYRLQNDQRRTQFITARALLRLLLSERLGVKPRALPITYSCHGKPQLAGTYRNAWQFSVSHSGAAVLIALCRDRAIGVDVERLRSTRWPSLLARVCDPHELAQARAEILLVGESAFFERWVAKEAVLKALGLGMTVSPTLIELRRRHDGALRVSGTLPRNLANSGQRCHLIPLAAPTDFVAALALI